MIPASISVLTICGIDEIPSHGSRAVSHVLSVIDPERPDLTEFGGYGEHHRTTLRFHDIIDPLPGRVMPAREHMEAILAFGENLKTSREDRRDGHLLVHCHMGVSRSTAAMLTLMADIEPEMPEDQLFARLRDIRPQAWPNSVMIAMADDMLGRSGRLTEQLRIHYGVQLKAQPKYNVWMKDLGRSRELEMAV
jgi:predicted protein tyrosine phosphatase